MTTAELLAKYHHPELIAKPDGGDGAHVCEVWEDGEVTLTKGGSLYGFRGLHMIEMPLSAALLVDVMPRKSRSGLHGNVVCHYEDAAAVRKIIADALGL